MKKIKDFIYNFSDIFTAILVLALAGGIIVWRVQVIMGYSEMMAAEKKETQIDIDFADVDLDPIDKPDYTDGEEEPVEEPELEQPLVIDAMPKLVSGCV